MQVFLLNTWQVIGEISLFFLSTNLQLATGEGSNYVLWLRGATSSQLSLNIFYDGFQWPEGWCPRGFPHNAGALLEARKAT